MEGRGGGTGEESRLAAAIDDTGPIRAADQLAAVRRMIRAGRELTVRHEHATHDDELGDLAGDLLVYASGRPRLGGEEEA